LPLLTDERTAVQILINEAAQRGPEGLNNFARTILGAHAEQAKHLATCAREGTLPPASDSETVTVTRTIEGREMAVSLKADKLPITSYEELVEFYEIDTDRWQPVKQVFNFWGSDASPHFQVKAEFREVEYKGLVEADREKVRDWYAQLAPQEWGPCQAQDESENLLEIVISDLHADKPSTDGSGLEEHLQRIRGGVRGLLSRAKAHGVARIALVFLGDTFEHEGDGLTSNGTRMETHGDPRESYRKVRDCIGQLTAQAAELAPVDLYVLSGNHDKERAWYAVDSLHGLFANHERVTVHTDTRRAAIDWGINLIGLWHGDRQKNVDIAMTLLREFDTRGKHVLEVHLGHEHSRREDEIHGVLLRRFRSPTPDNAWAADNLFNHSGKSITGILWSRDRGEIATYPVNFVGDA
jgi:hypothetical protein